MTAIDKPTKDDKFGFKPYVEGIADLVRQTKVEDLPITIGIYGAWGAGKTSFIMQLENLLHEDTGHNIPTVWFDAWKYDCTSDVRSALIFNILSKIHAEAKGKTKTAITKSFEKVVNASKTLALQTQITAGTHGVGLSLPPLAQLIDNVDKAEEFRTSVDSLANGFAEAVSAYLKNYSRDEKNKLIIFVDDLDRCLPENVITILEALKLFLDRAPCVFIIAVDRTVVEKAIQNHYGTDPGISGRDYLDKIVQFPFTIPPINSSKLQTCFKELIKADDINDKCLRVFTRTAEGNPRIFLRLINSWRLYSSLAPHIIPDLWGDKSKRHVLAIAVALHIRWPDLHELGRHNPNGLMKLTEYCLNNSPSLPIDKAFTNSNAIEYLPFWHNALSHNFFHDLGAIGHNTGEIFVSNESLKAALELSSSGS